MNNLELFAFRVKKLRKARKLSQQGLAEVLGLTQTAISGIMLVFTLFIDVMRTRKAKRKGLI